MARRTLVAAAEIERIVARIAHQIVEPDDVDAGLVLIGIRRGGERFTRRLARKVEDITGIRPGLGFLNINLYRDDAVARDLPESDIPDDVSGKVVVVVDDVLFTGRSVRSALDAVTDLGRPKVVRLAVLVDRGLRELPVQADYVGRVIPTSRREFVEVRLGSAYDEDDSVTIRSEDDGA